MFLYFILPNHLLQSSTDIFMRHNQMFMCVGLFVLLSLSPSRFIPQPLRRKAARQEVPKMFWQFWTAELRNFLSLNKHATSTNLTKILYCCQKEGEVWGEKNVSLPTPRQSHWYQWSCPTTQQPSTPITKRGGGGVTPHWHPQWPTGCQ